MGVGAGISRFGFGTVQEHEIELSKNASDDRKLLLFLQRNLPCFLSRCGMHQPDM